MPIETNLNTSPYFDDFDQNKDFYKILFRPGVALQARELTQLQSILQKQIERFGDHIFKSGTIVSGINFQFNSKYDYVKILDLQADGQPIVVSGYEGLNLRNSSNLVSKVVNVKSGYQSRDPEGSYLFVKYLNSGTSGSSSNYSNSEVLTVYSDSYELFDMTVASGSTGYSNSDTVEVVSSLIVASSNVTSGAAVSQTIGSNTANVYVIESNSTFGTITIDDVSYSNTDGYKLLKIRPIYNDLSNTSATSGKWTITAGHNIVQGSNTANVVAKVGSGATAVITTDGSGIIVDASVVSRGSNYFVPPYVAVKSGTGVHSSLDITAQNYKAQVTVADSSFNAEGTKPVGNGYAFSITEGVVYQKGLFLRVDAQTIVVNAYSSNVDSVTVGLVSTEVIANSNTDDTLLDVATGSPNFAAPGADRLTLTPTLTVINSVDVAANNTFAPLVEFRNGQPYRQYNTTLYNILAKEFETRMADTNGNFVIDPFQLSSRDRTTYSNTHFDVVVDPGLSYINGKKIQTIKNTYLPVRRGTDTKVANTRTITLNYGSYVLVNEYAGYFDFKSGAEIDLYDTAQQYITNRSTSISPTGTKIGTAKMRSVMYDNGTVGTADAQYRLYLFDIRMNRGRTFRETKSVYYNGTIDGIADVVLRNDPSSSQNIAILSDTKFSSLVFPVGNKAIKNTNTVDYLYRTTNTTANVGSNAVLTFTISDTFAAGSDINLNSVQRRDIVITPIANATSTNTVTSVTATNASNTISGSGLTGAYAAGDFIKIQNASNTAQTQYTQVTTIANSTHMSVSNNWTYATISTGTVARHFPANIPIVIDDSRTSGNISSTGTTLSINISNTADQVAFSALVPVTVGYSAKKISSTEVHKNVNRGILVKIDLTTHSSGRTGPWCLGVPDAFRLNAVYASTNSTVNTNCTDISRHFYVDNGQKDDYYGHAHLVAYHTTFDLGSTSTLLVEFDAFTLDNPTDAGFFSIDSYDLSSNNSSRTALGNTAINILEVPEFRNAKGEVLDLRDCFDYRPRVSNTANVTSTESLVTTNPANTVAFGTHDKLFPVPDSEFDFSYEYFLQRTDRVVIDNTSDIKVLEGTPSEDVVVPPDAPSNCITIGYINVPPYPSLPTVPNVNIADFASKKSGSGSPINHKVSQYTIKEKLFNNHTIQPKRFTMADIGKLERRIEDLEYYTSLSLLENKTKNLSIPSSIDPSRNRFKNGFFVEQFDDYLQADTQSKEFNSCIEQERSVLNATEATYNIQARFNYNDTTTRNNIHMEGDHVTEPGMGKWGEAVVTLPITSHFTLVDQQKFTSAVTGDGTNTKYAGEMVIEPSSFKQLLNAEVRLTGADAGPAPVPPLTVSATPVSSSTYIAGYKAERLTEEVRAYAVGTPQTTMKHTPEKSMYPLFSFWNGKTNDTFSQTNGGIDIRGTVTWQVIGYFYAQTTGSYTFRMTPLHNGTASLWFGAGQADTGATIANAKFHRQAKASSCVYTVSLTSGTYYPIRMHLNNTSMCSSTDHGWNFYVTTPGGDIKTMSQTQGWYFYKDFPAAVPAPPSPPPPAGGGGGGCKIICTKLHELGYLPHDIFEADQKFGELLREKDPESYYGYIKWASVVVDWMSGTGPQCMFWIKDPVKRANVQRDLAIAWARKIATPWAEHMAYTMGVLPKDNKVGRLLMSVGKLASKVVNKFVKADTINKDSKLSGYALWFVFAILRVVALFNISKD